MQTALWVNGRSCVLTLHMCRLEQNNWHNMRLLHNDHDEAGAASCKLDEPSPINVMANLELEKKNNVQLKCNYFNEKPKQSRSNELSRYYA